MPTLMKVSPFFCPSNRAAAAWSVASLKSDGSSSSSAAADAEDVAAGAFEEGPPTSAKDRSNGNRIFVGLLLWRWRGKCGRKGAVGRTLQLAGLPLLSAGGAAERESDSVRGGFG
mmetsp:Transcript_6193/g.14942  ORF Transcript_6193/g.14942 Transcript_6193/m.14942 type:complete len:115 (+) Transcript_6193:917-1261(+)